MAKKTVASLKKADAKVFTTIDYNDLLADMDMIVTATSGADRLSAAVAAINDQAADHQACARIFAAHKFPAARPLWNGERYRHDRIRIAYVSPDLREHPVGHLMAAIRCRGEPLRSGLGQHAAMLFGEVIIVHCPGDVEIRVGVEALDKA